LPPRSALASFCLFRLHEKSAPEDGAASTEQTPCYLAFVWSTLHKDPVVVRIGLVEDIDPLISSWREEIAYAAHVTDPFAGEAEADCRASGAILRRKIWDPLLPYLEGANQVFLVPDGELNLVNFGALPGRVKPYLIEEDPLIHYLSAERDLIVEYEPIRKGVGLLALGGPDYDSELPPDGSGDGRIAADDASPLRGERLPCADFTRLRFEPLPGAAREAREIADLWTTEGEVMRLTGAAATESAFKRHASGREVIHLATHGFFLGGLCGARSPTGGTRGVGRLVISGDEESASVEGTEADSVTRRLSAPLVEENPLLLSGLALAGANRRESISDHQEDGVLTAEEIAALDLADVSWAVLSACDTGVGEVRTGEGVLGLRRAFNVAGVPTLIMSLWPVEDETTREWMRALYENRLVRGHSAAESVREAGRSLLGARRRRGESTHPFYWGAFLATGGL
jgi:CHAT domain-containing protein